MEKTIEQLKSEGFDTIRQIEFLSLQIKQLQMSLQETIKKIQQQENSSIKKK